MSTHYLCIQINELLIDKMSISVDFSQRSNKSFSFWSRLFLRYLLILKRNVYGWKECICFSPIEGTAHTHICCWGLKDRNWAIRFSKYCVVSIKFLAYYKIFKCSLPCFVVFFSNLKFFKWYLCKILFNNTDILLYN